MIEFKPFVEEGVVEIQVHGKLQSVDFDKISPVVDEMIEHKSKIKGLILNVTEFDGWDGIDALFRHFAFVKGHHRYIERVAAVGNKSWQRLLPKLASLFVKAEPRYFDVEEIDLAKQWVRDESFRQLTI